jgi:hypothetical protein
VLFKDTIWNHMAGAPSGFGFAGSSFVSPLFLSSSLFSEQICLYLPGFTHYDYPGIYQYQDFHHCGLEPGDNIVDYKNAIEVWTCQLVGLAEYVPHFVSMAPHFR